MFGERELTSEERETMQAVQRIHALALVADKQHQALTLLLSHRTTDDGRVLQLLEQYLQTLERLAGVASDI